MSRVQFALNGDDIDDAIAFCSKLFGVEPAKRRPGYADYVLEHPPLKLVLLENAGQGGTSNHLGVEHSDLDGVAAAADRLDRGQDSRRWHGRAGCGQRGGLRDRRLLRHHWRDGRCGSSRHRGVLRLAGEQRRCGSACAAGSVTFAPCPRRTAGRTVEDVGTSATPEPSPAGRAPHRPPDGSRLFAVVARSHHLRVPRGAGRVTATRRGRWIDHALEPDATQRMANALPAADASDTPTRCPDGRAPR